MTHTATQLSLLDGMAAKEHGRDEVEAAYSSWVGTMRVVAQGICQRQGYVTTDDIHRHVEREGLFPAKNTAFTGIFRGKGWQDIGFMPSELKTNHARLIRKWVWRG